MVADQEHARAGRCTVRMPTGPARTSRRPRERRCAPWLGFSVTSIYLRRFDSRTRLYPMNENSPAAMPTAISNQPKGISANDSRRKPSRSMDAPMIRWASRHRRPTLTNRTEHHRAIAALPRAGARTFDGRSAGMDQGGTNQVNLIGAGHRCGVCRHCVATTPPTGIGIAMPGRRRAVGAVTILGTNLLPDSVPLPSRLFPGIPPCTNADSVQAVASFQARTAW